MEETPKKIASPKDAVAIAGPACECIYGPPDPRIFDDHGHDEDNLIGIDPDVDADFDVDIDPVADVYGPPIEIDLINGPIEFVEVDGELLDLDNIKVDDDFIDQIIADED